MTSTLEAPRPLIFVPLADECSKGGVHNPVTKAEKHNGVYVYFTYCSKCGILLSSPTY